MTVVGARPQFVKAAVVVRELCASGMLHSIIVHTGQHYDEDMSDVFFRQLEIPAPDSNLAIGSGPHGMQTGRMLESLEQQMMELKPDIVAVYGDTNSTLAAALAAAKLHIRVAHVEAGLRSFNRAMPEEINRVVTDHLSDILFTPSQVAVQNLRHEGIPENRIHTVGDVMYDAALHFGARAETESQILQHLGVVSRNYILATVHRAENTDDPDRLRRITEAFTDIAGNTPVVWPMHPRTRNALLKLGVHDLLNSRDLIVCSPMGFIDMAKLETNALVVATDSGGVQKEAFFYQVPCVTLRQETEWVELLDLGWNRLARMDTRQHISAAILGAIGTRGVEARPYGSGDAAKRIVRVLQTALAL